MLCFKILTSWIAGLLLFAGCSISGADKVADAYCDCYQPVMAAQEAVMQGIADSLPQAKQTALIDAFEYARIASRSCLAAAKKEQDAASISDQVLAKAMEASCPAIFDYFSGEVAP